MQYDPKLLKYSYNNIVRLTRAVKLPLSICYRCPRSHVAFVKKIFPYIPIEAAPDAIEGIIHQIESKDIEKLVKHGDIIIARKNAPLVSLCIRLIGQGDRPSTSDACGGRSPTPFIL